jgi:hypothetical protein
VKDYIGNDISANYFRGIEAVGGKIHFDKTGLIFRSHAFNIQSGETRIEYSQITKITRRNTLGIVPNGISIFTKDNFEHKFVINNRNSVIEFLQSRLLYTNLEMHK